MDEMNVHGCLDLALLGRLTLQRKSAFATLLALQATGEVGTGASIVSDGILAIGIDKFEITATKIGVNIFNCQDIRKEIVLNDIRRATVIALWAIYTIWNAIIVVDDVGSVASQSTPWRTSVEGWNINLADVHCECP